jgi:hypothetical protein
MILGFMILRPAVAAGKRKYSRLSFFGANGVLMVRALVVS